MGPFFPGGKQEPPAAEMPRALINFADPNWFSTMRMPILRGRGIEERDQPGAPTVVVINQTAAKRFWPNQDPIGQTIIFPGAKITAEIVGVVGNIKHFQLEDPEVPQVYGSIAQNPFIFSTLVVRTHRDPMAISNEVRRAVWSVDKDQPVWKVRSLESMIENSISPRRFTMLLLSGYAGIALLLAAIGIFGVISYAVGQRTAEIGVRVALGAAPRHVLAMILRQGLLMTLSGIAIGALAALGLTRFLQSQLFAVRNTDPLVYAGVAVLLSIVAIAACVLPARRALRVDPTVALRYE
jgi:putative ABC transport system permease protein